jgi:hypothetical protein
MSKTANLLRNVEVPTQNRIESPRDVPITDNDSTVYNLNGDSSTSTRHNINGVPFILTKDSRTEGALQSTFNRRVRDQSNGGTVVKTLANIPEMAGRPLEHQQLASDPANLDRPLYWNTAYTAKGIDDVRDDPTRTTAAVPVPLNNDKDFGGPAGTKGDGFDDREAKGFYLERGLFGQGLSAPQYYKAIPDSLSRTGLVIRERPSQNAALARPTLPAYTAADFENYKEAYAGYLKSQYVVLFAGRNITGYFFDQIKNATYNKNYPEQNFIVTEDEFIDHRESSWMAANYGIDPSNYIGGQSYRQNVLTLNVRAIQDFLAKTTLRAIDTVLDNVPDPDPASGTVVTRAFAKSRFNGLIYVHRTRRSKTFHSKIFQDFAWTAPTPNGSNIPFSKYFPGKHYKAPTKAGIAGANYNSLTDTREGDGPYETTRCAVRIRGGLRVDSPYYPNDTENDVPRKQYAAINWDAPANGNIGLANSGLTIVTPNRCYMWGDFNTTTHTDPTDSNKQLTVPCAVFADGITGLSSNWRDSVWQDYQTWSSKTYGTWTPKYMAATTKYITSMVTNNVPMTEWNVTSFGTGGAGEMIYMVENWKEADFVFRGSMVVLNEQRYSKCGHCYMPSILTNQVGVFETGPVEFKFNTDLLTRDGQPPFSPWGFQVTRVVSTVNVFDN